MKNKSLLFLAIFTLTQGAYCADDADEKYYESKYPGAVRMLKRVESVHSAQDALNFFSNSTRGELQEIFDGLNDDRTFKIIKKKKVFDDAPLSEDQTRLATWYLKRWSPSYLDAGVGTVVSLADLLPLLVPALGKNEQAQKITALIAAIGTGVNIPTQPGITNLVGLQTLPSQINRFKKAPLLAKLFNKKMSADKQEAFDTLRKKLAITSALSILSRTTAAIPSLSLDWSLRAEILGFILSIMRSTYSRKTWNLLLEYAHKAEKKERKKAKKKNKKKAAQHIVEEDDESEDNSDELEEDAE